MTALPERLDLASMDIADDRRQALLELLPEVRTEDGKIDFDRLRLALGEAVDVGRERYGMTWPGKADCFKTIQAPSLATLRPCPEESVNFDTTENLIIEGDNLEVLKLLQKSYLGKVKMIYIDPPYNTGNDFIYPDNFSESLQTYLEYTGQADSEGRKFGTNTDADGRFHSKWINMMYPRLYLARNLLTRDGVIFVSCDDGELVNLRSLMNEIYGEGNFLATIIWQKVYAPKSSARHFSTDHDYIVVYAAESEGWRPELLSRTPEQDAVYKNPDNDPRGPWRPNNLAARNYYSKGTYSIQCPGGRVIEGPPKGSYWRVSEERFWELDGDRRIWWGEDGNNIPAPKIFLSEVKQGRVPQTLWMYKDVGHTQDAKKELLGLVPFEHTENVLDTVKPTRLIRRMLEIATVPGQSDLILDFFAGSGSTAQAIIDQNEADGGNRRFILVQLPEPLPKPEQRLRTISDLTKERTRNVTARIQHARASKLAGTPSPPSEGFRVFKLSDSNFEPWNAGQSRDRGELEAQLELHIDHTRGGRSQDDVLYELLLKSGFPLTAEVELLTVEGKMVFSVARGALLVCLEQELNLELIRAMAKLQPERVLCLDEGFAGNDQLKTNAVLTFRDAGVTAFKTV